MDDQEVQAMHTKSVPTIKFYPAGASRIRFELTLSEHYTLAGDYLRGELQGVTLRKNHPNTAENDVKGKSDGRH